MLRLWQKCLVPVLASWVCALALAFAGLSLTLAPWLRGSGSARAIIAPLMFITFGKASELATVLGIPVGFAVGTRRFLSQRPSLNAKARRGWRSGLVIVCSLGALAATIGLARLNALSLVPGRMARSALLMARERCLQAPGKNVPIPVLGAAWICGANRSARLEGSLPGSNHRVWFSAGNVQVSDDLLSVDLDDLDVGVRSLSEQSPKVRFRTAHATVHGARSAFRQAGLRPWLRAALAASTGFLLAGVIAYRILVHAWFERRKSWGISVAAAFASAATFVGTDEFASRVAAVYLAVPVMGLLAAWIVGKVVTRSARAEAKVT